MTTRKAAVSERSSRSRHRRSRGLLPESSRLARARSPASPSTRRGRASGHRRTHAATTPVRLRPFGVGLGRSLCQGWTAWLLPSGLLNLRHTAVANQVRSVRQRQDYPESRRERRAGLPVPGEDSIQFPNRELDFTFHVKVVNRFQAGRAGNNPLLRLSVAVANSAHVSRLDGNVNARSPPL